ncbi:MAG TPA: amino acid adenylation domain-containing protein, partial [Longimicrobiaceae bacterium]|nr:amino acid adenylation domain-containing protein [Longimicrobiaceae bacterium]
MSSTIREAGQAQSAEEKRRLLARLLQQKAARSSGFPLSFAQQRLWFLYQFDPGSPLYNMPAAFRLQGELDVGVLERAFSEVVRRHEVLRTTFLMEGGEPQQVVAPAGPWRLVVEDVGERDEAEVDRRLREEANRPFDLQSGPLFRAMLLRLSARGHVLLVTLHHIVSDGWSMEILFRELASLYEAFLRGQPSPLPELPIQYADFALWQRERLRGAVLERQLTYWKEHLAGAPAVLELPMDRPRPAVQSFRGALVPVRLEAEVTQGLQRVARREGATLFMVLLAAYKVLLSRYARQEDVVVGSPIAGRTRREVEGLIGLFINTLALRTDLGGEPGFGEVVGRVREGLLGAHAHQELPFERLVGELQVERSLSHTPVFQVLFSLQNLARPFEFGGVRAVPLDPATGTAKFDLSLVLQEEDSVLSGYAEYSTDLFDRSTVERMLEHLRVFLEAAVADPDQRISRLPLLSAPERRQLLEVWNQVEGAYPSGRTLHGLFSEQAARTPGAPAVACEGESLDYAELERRANRLAHRLRRQGVGPEARVGICLERSLEMVVAILGVLKAGGAYVPLDPGYPAERLALVLEDSGVRVLLTQERLLGVLPEHGVETVCLDRDREEIGRESAVAPGEAAGPENLAYVIYTSGSTGKPKGVMVTHRNVVRLFTATEAWFGFGPDDVWTLFHSYAFDFSVWEIWGALLYGGRLVVVPYLTSRSPEAFYRLLARERVTVLNQTPSAFRQLVQAEEELGVPDGLALRLVVFGGEALELQSLRPWMERHGDERPLLVNMFGITETTVHVTYRPIRRADVETGSGSVIGRTIPDLRIYLLDPHLQPVPVGVPGELYVGGAGVARGYLNREELTRERFLPDPFRPGERVYRSGDLARYRADGDLEYLGRIDHQVKVRGFRIELGEIEAALAALEGVREAVVVVYGEGAGEKRLVGYVAGEPGLDTAELRAALRERLPEHMVPAALVALERLPLTPNGKTDRRALPDPQWGGAAGAYVAPRDETEEILCGAWAEVLGTERVGVRDNFFDLGGDSILSIRVLARARERGLEFTIPDLFQHQTVEELAAFLRTGGASAERRAATLPFSQISEADRARLPARVEDAYPATLLQLGMLFHGQQGREDILYHNLTSIPVHAVFDAEAWRRTMEAVMRRHAVLRTSFDLSHYAEPLQLVHRELPVPLFLHDLSALPPKEQDTALDAWFQAEKHRPFDPACAPLFRVHVHRRGPDWFQLGLVEHHAILDGWSVATLLNELLEGYLRELDGVGAEVEPLQTEFRDFVALEREVVGSPEQRRFWEERLRDRPDTCITGWAGERPAETGERIAFRGVYLPPELGAGLTRVAKEAQAPLKSVLLSAHLRVLVLLSGQAEVLTGLVTNGRPEGSDGERVLGLFLNTVPFRVTLGGGTWVDLVRTAFAAEREILPYRRFPLAEMQRQHRGEALFETAFNFVHFHVLDRTPSSGRLRLGSVKAFGRNSFAFMVNFVMTGERAELVIQYDRASYTDEQLDRISGYFRRALEAMARAPLAPHRECDLLDPAERRQVLEGWNATGRPYPVGRTLHGLFSEQAARTPGAVAVVSGEERLRYAELEGWANRLADALRQRGVGPETRVGVCMERSVEMVVALLGVLKAGGAYVPLDPAYPAERIAYMLEDSAVPVLLTQERLLEGLPVRGTDVVCLDRDWPRIAAGNTEPLEGGAGPENLAYVIYTSGSTGRPKGAMNEHRAIVNRLLWMQEEYGLDASDTVLQKTPFSFDVSVWEFFWPLLAGARLVLARPEGHLDPHYLSELIEREGVTTLHFVPPMLQAFLEAGQPERCGSVRRVICSGEALPYELMERALDALPAAGLHNLYGPTEAAVDVTYWECGRRAGRQVVPIGRPAANTRIYLLDDTLDPVPVGVAGELFIGGAQVGRGYLGRPELTAERFVPDPFSGEAGGRLYRTGDLARWLPTGELEYLGRIDHQVKVRGFRIELGEIEAALLAQEGVREAVVTVHGQGAVEKRLVAYVVADPDATPARLREGLRGRLPEYMVPSAFVPLERLPLTPNGKTDRRALPDPQWGVVEQVYVAPQTETEVALCGIWSSVLGVERVGALDDFFDLGGHSLLAMQVMARVQAALGVEIPLQALFDAPTVAGLAARVETTLRAGAGVQAPPIVPALRDGGPLPLSFAQQRLWLIQQMELRSAAYNVPVALRLRGALDRRALEGALAGLVRRHEALRTVFARAEGGPVQVVLPPGPRPLPGVDLTALPAAAREAEARRLAEADAARPFDLARGPLLRAALVQTGEGEHVLLLCMHHIVSDGWSMGVLFREVSALYNAFVAGRPSPLPELPVQYADYALWQRAWLSGETLDAQLAYWRVRLDGAPPLLELPTDHPRPAVAGNRGAVRGFVLSAVGTQALRALARREGTTLFTVLLAGFQALLARYAGTEDVLVGTPVAGRTRLETESLIGFFVNTLVVRTDLSADPTARELVGRVRERVMGAHAHQDVPFERLVEELRVERSL